MDTHTIIQQSLGSYLTKPQPAYPRSLAPELAQWHCHTVDGGHSVLGLLAEQVQPWPIDPNGYLVPIPVKSVERGYRVERGYIVATSPDVRYDPQLGLLTPAGDDEY